MTGKERIRKAFTLMTTDQTPWVPFAGVHCAFLSGLPADEYLKSEGHIIRGVGRAVELYEPDGIPVVFDLQVEAEVLGCQLKWVSDNPPAVVSHPLAEGLTLEQLPEFNKQQGRIPVCLSAATELRKKFPDIALYGLVTGPFTLAVHLAGTNIFMQMMEDPETVTEILTYCSGITKKMASWYLEAGCDVIAVVDPMTSQIDPVSFEQFVSHPISDVFQKIREQHGLSSFFVCGFAQHNIEAMCKCRPDNISIDENIPLDFVKEMAAKYGLSFGGNLKLTSVLSLGSVQDVEKHTLETMELGGETGFILAPGCDLVMDTPVENLQAVTQTVLKRHHAVDSQEAQKNVPETEHEAFKKRWKKDKVIIDIITLDSSSCAPCQYMFKAVTLAAEGFGDKVICKENSIKTKEGLQLMEALGVRNVPVTVIDGEICFVSQIPPRADLEEAIREKLRQKGLIR
ncbi:MAG: uroporphyrinogen decarboxylase family protein [Bacteroidales bacterium]|nr:uroporphyrinogen decarboxylase family protein [Bacteroidales bacterium]